MCALTSVVIPKGVTPFAVTMYKHTSIGVNKYVKSFRLLKVILGITMSPNLIGFLVLAPILRCLLEIHGPIKLYFYAFPLS